MEEVMRLKWWDHGLPSPYELAVMIHGFSRIPFTVDVVLRDLKRFIGITSKAVLGKIILRGVRLGIFSDQGDGRYDVVDLRKLLVQSSVKSAVESSLRIHMSSVPPSFEEVKPTSEIDIESFVVVKVPELSTLLRASDLLKVYTVETSYDVVEFFNKEKEIVTFLSPESLRVIRKFSDLENYRLAPFTVDVGAPLYGTLEIPGFGCEDVVVSSPKSEYLVRRSDIETYIVRKSIDSILYLSFQAYVEGTSLRAVLRSPLVHCFSPLGKLVAVSPLEKATTLYVIHHENVSPREVFQVLSKILAERKPQRIEEPLFHKFVKFLRVLPLDGLAICKNCGDIIPDTSQYCHHCGSVIGRYESIRHVHYVQSGSVGGIAARILEVDGQFQCNYCGRAAERKLILPNGVVRLVCKSCASALVVRGESRKCSRCGRYVKKFKRTSKEVLCKQCYYIKYWEKVKRKIEVFMEFFLREVSLEDVKRVFDNIISFYFSRSSRSPSSNLIAEEVLATLVYEYNLSISLKEIVEVISGVNEPSSKRKAHDLRTRVSRHMVRLYLKRSNPRRDIVSGLRIVAYRHQKCN